MPSFATARRRARDAQTRNRLGARDLRKTRTRDMASQMENENLLEKLLARVQVALRGVEEHPRVGERRDVERMHLTHTRVRVAGGKKEGNKDDREKKKAREGVGKAEPREEKGDERGNERRDTDKTKTHDETKTTAKDERTRRGRRENDARMT
eukprot:2573462-Rhodomonas_salina.1